MKTKTKKQQALQVIDPISKHAMKLAHKQRKVSLKNALNTIKQFAVPSCSPDMFEEFEQLSKYLTNMYK